MEKRNYIKYIHENESTESNELNENFSGRDDNNWYKRFLKELIELDPNNFPEIKEKEKIKRAEGEEGQKNKGEDQKSEGEEGLDLLRFRSFNLFRIRSFDLHLCSFDLLYLDKPGDNYRYATNIQKLWQSIYEHKNKSNKRKYFENKENFQQLQSKKLKGCNNNWETMEEKAKKVEKMSKNEIRQPKCGNSEKFDKGKTIQTIFDEAGRQLLNYVNNLKDDNYETSAFVVMSVGSRKLIWEKVY
ncbi:hypothetical protein C2G38_2040649 [Gigaspora rosea]|uniref:Uncharacterized protein n=1 Tax=Gigaspora rosea TaxID=44941 RepID=A0A397UW58_9GLOM|nr:hypothetical protein C2G38_2040649 [Gigaspora rosea]